MNRSAPRPRVHRAPLLAWGQLADVVGCGSSSLRAPSKDGRPPAPGRPGTHTVPPREELAGFSGGPWQKPQRDSPPVADRSSSAASESVAHRGPRGFVFLAKQRPHQRTASAGCSSDYGTYVDKIRLFPYFGVLIPHRALAGTLGNSPAAPYPEGRTPRERGKSPSRVGVGSWRSEDLQEHHDIICKCRRSRAALLRCHLD